MKKRDDNLIKIGIIILIIIAIALLSYFFMNKITGNIISPPFGSGKISDYTYKIYEGKTIQVNSDYFLFNITVDQVLKDKIILSITGDPGYLTGLEISLGDSGSFFEAFKFNLTKIVYSNTKTISKNPQKFFNYAILELKPLTKIAYPDLHNCDRVFSFEPNGEVTTTEGDIFPAGQTAGIVFSNCFFDYNNGTLMRDPQVTCENFDDKGFSVVQMFGGGPGPGEFWPGYYLAGYICYNPSTKIISTPFMVTSDCCAVKKLMLDTTSIIYNPSLGEEQDYFKQNTTKNETLMFNFKTGKYDIK